MVEAEHAPRETPSRHRLARRAAVALFLASLTTQTICHATRNMRIGSDHRMYAAVARNFLTGRGLLLDEDHVAWLPPGYPLFVAGIWSVTGTGNWPVKAVQIPLNALAVVLVQYLATRLFSPRVGVLAGVLALLYPRFVIYAGCLRTEGVAVFLSVLIVVVFVEAALRSRWWLCAVGGVLVGALALTRPANLPLIAVVATWLLLCTPLSLRRKLGFSAVAAGLFVATLAPWTWRNYRLMGRFVPVSSMSGLSASISLVRARGEGVVVQKAGTVKDDSMFGNDESDGDWSPVLRYYRDHPSELVTLTLWRLRTFWGPGYALNKYSVYGDVSFVMWLVLVPLGVFGVVLSLRKHWRMALALLIVPASLTAVHSLVHANPRYNLPAMPFVFIFAAVAIGWLRDRLQARARARGAATAQRPDSPKPRRLRGDAVEGRATLWAALKMLKIGVASGLLTLAPACEGTAPDPVPRVTDPVPVPLCSLSTPSHSIELLFDPDSKASVLRLDGGERVTQPIRGVPVQAVEVSPGRLVVFARAVFSGRLHALELRGPPWVAHPVSLPAALGRGIFRRATVHRGAVLFVHYDPAERRAFLCRLLVSGPAARLDRPFQRELDFRRDILSAHVFIGSDGERVFVGCRNLLLSGPASSSDDSLALTDVGDGQVLVEGAAGPGGAYAIYRDESTAVTPGSRLPDSSPYRIVDLRTGKAVEWDRRSGAPFGLRVEKGKPRYAIASTARAVGEMFRADVVRACDSGLLRLGVGNRDGRVAWSQVYYLHAFLDALALMRDDDAVRAALGPLRDAIRSRLDLEIRLLGELTDPKHPVGLAATRYTPDHRPALHVAHTGRVLYLLKRYRRLVRDPVPLPGFEAFEAWVQRAEGHAARLVEPAGHRRDDLPQRRHFTWPPAFTPRRWVSPMLPYNQQNAWATGVAYGLAPGDAGKPWALAARDVVLLLVERETLRTSPPTDHGWRYCWGRPEKVAHILYRTMDARAMLVVGAQFPEVGADRLRPYLRSGVEAGHLAPALSRELAAAGERPAIPQAIALRYCRAVTPWELENAVAVYGALLGR